jgi:hypothetical protein
MSDQEKKPEGEHPCDNGTCNCDGPEARECRGEVPLTLESMGLLPFMEGESLRCPKCSAVGSQVNYHEMIILTVSDDKFPCQEWVEKNLLGGTITEHLCVRCQRCRYGFPMRTADSG